MIAHARRLSLEVRANMLTVRLGFRDHAAESFVAVDIDAERADRFTGDLLNLAGYKVPESERGQHLAGLNVYNVRLPSGEVQTAWTFYQHSDDLRVRATEYLDLDQTEELALALAEQYGWEVTGG